MNQYRCETCKKKYCFYRAVADYRIFTDENGCTLHSDFQSDLERVLDKLVEWMDIQIPRDDLNHPFYECKIRTKKKIEELREGKGDS